MNIIIAHVDKDWVNILSSKIKARGDITTIICKTGMAVSSRLKNNGIDAVVMSMSVPGTDVITLMKDHAADIPFLVLCPTGRDDVVGMLYDNGASQVFCCPYDMTAIVSRVYDWATSKGMESIKQKLNGSANNPISVHNIDSIITSVLNEIGVPHTSGRGYIIDAVRMGVNKPSTLHQITKIIYTDVGKANGKTWQTVEHAMRVAVAKCWKTGNTRRIDEVFGYTYSPDKGHPTNSEFLAGIVDYIRVNYINGV